MLGTVPGAKQTSLMESISTAGRNYPGTQGENVLTAVKIVQINKNSYEISDKINRKAIDHSKWIA